MPKFVIGVLLQLSTAVASLLQPQQQDSLSLDPDLVQANQQLRYEAWNTKTRVPYKPSSQTFQDQQEGTVFELREVLQHLVCHNPLERNWSPDQVKLLVDKIAKLTFTRRSESEIATLVHLLWEIDLSFDYKSSSKWDPVLSESFSEPFRKKQVGFRRAAQALLGLSPYKSLLAQLNWLRIDSCLWNLQYVCNAEFGIDTDETKEYGGYLCSVRERLLKLYELYNKTTLVTILNEPNCKLLATSYNLDAYTKLAIAAPEEAPRSKLARLLHVPLEKKEKPGVGTMPRVADWYFNRAKNLFLKKMADGSVYAPVITEHGNATGCYSLLYKNMEDFVCTINPELDAEPFSLVISGRLQTLTALLKTRNDVRFPTLQVDRGKFSFDNGIYITYKDEFVSYGKLTMLSKKSSINYFKQVFEDALYRHTMELHKNEPYPEFFIKARPLQEIYDHQGLPPITQQFTNCLLGRILYRLGDKDKWEVWLYFKGKAGTGKSSILLIFVHMYPPQYIGILSNNIEENFTLQGLIGKIIYMCPDCQGDWGLDQALWLSMVTGEWTSIAIKHKIAVKKLFDLPGVAAGNRYPGFKNQSGNVQRRIACVMLNKEVLIVDTSLSQRMLEAHAPILAKINKSYLNIVKQAHGQSIWMVLPIDFVKNMKNVAENTNSLFAFLQSHDVKITGKHYMTRKAFETAYNAYCTTHNCPSVSLTKENTDFIFQSHGMIYAKEKLNPKVSYILGAHLRTEGNPLQIDSLDNFVPESNEDDLSNVGHPIKIADPKADTRHEWNPVGLKKLVMPALSKIMRAGRRGMSLAEEFVANYPDLYTTVAPGGNAASTHAPPPAPSNTHNQTFEDYLHQPQNQPPPQVGADASGGEHLAAREQTQADDDMHTLSPNLNNGLSAWSQFSAKGRYPIAHANMGEEAKRPEGPTAREGLPKRPEVLAALLGNIQRNRERQTAEQRDPSRSAQLKSLSTSLSMASASSQTSHIQAFLKRMQTAPVRDTRTSEERVNARNAYAPPVLAPVSVTAIYNAAMAPSAERDRGVVANVIGQDGQRRTFYGF